MFAIWARVGPVAITTWLAFRMRPSWSWTWKYFTLLLEPSPLLSVTLSSPSVSRSCVQSFSSSITGVICSTVPFTSTLSKLYLSTCMFRFTHIIIWELAMLRFRGSCCSKDNVGIRLTPTTPLYSYRRRTFYDFGSDVLLWVIYCLMQLLSTLLSRDPLEGWLPSLSRCVIFSVFPLF